MCAPLRTNTKPFKHLIFLFTGQGVTATCKTILFQNSIHSSAAAKVRLKHKAISQIAIHKANRVKQQQQHCTTGSQRTDQMPSACSERAYTYERVLVT